MSFGMRDWRDGRACGGTRQLRRLARAGPGVQWLRGRVRGRPGRRRPGLRHAVPAAHAARLGGGGRSGRGPRPPRAPPPYGRLARGGVGAGGSGGGGPPPGPLSAPEPVLARLIAMEDDGPDVVRGAFDWHPLPAAPYAV